MYEIKKKGLRLITKETKLKETTTEYNELKLTSDPVLRARKLQHTKLQKLQRYSGDLLTPTKKSLKGVL